MPNSTSGYDITPLAPDRVDALGRSLTAEQWRITRSAGTEAPFCGGLLDRKEPGVYACILCGLPLYGDGAKFDSGTGWPSFHSAIDPDHVREVPDDSHGMVRTELRCTRCDSHLGHVFDDGPPPTGRRHCLNSAALRFVPAAEDGTSPAAPPTGFARVYLSTGGESDAAPWFASLAGVLDVTPGRSDPPSPERSDPLPTIEVVHDPGRLSLRDLLAAFLADSLSERGADAGEGAAVLLLEDAECALARAVIAEWSLGGGRSEAVEVFRATTFLPADG